MLLTGSISVVLTALHLLLAKTAEAGPAAGVNADGIMVVSPTRSHHAASLGSGITGDGAGGAMVRVVVPHAVCGSILGREGATLKSFIDDSGAAIHVSSRDAMPHGIFDRVVTITGSLDQAMRATALIGNRVTSDPHYPVMTRPLPWTHAPPGAGGGDRMHGAGNSTRSGGAGNNGDDAGGHSMELRVTETQVGAIIGRGGHTIREIESLTGVRIHVEPRAGEPRRRGSGGGDEDDRGDGDSSMATDSDAGEGDAERLRLVRITGPMDMVAAAHGASVTCQPGCPPVRFSDFFPPGASLPQRLCAPR